MWTQICIKISIMYLYYETPKRCLHTLTKNSHETVKKGSCFYANDCNNRIMSFKKCFEKIDLFTIFGKRLVFYVSNHGFQEFQIWLKFSSIDIAILIYCSYFNKSCKNDLFFWLLFCGFTYNFFSSHASDLKSNHVVSGPTQQGFLTFLTRPNACMMDEVMI